MNSRALRLPLLALLASLTFACLAIPATADAAVSCSGPGHFGQASPINGWAQRSSTGAQLWPPKYCRIGEQYSEWDCVWNGSSFQPTNVTSYSPAMCWY